MQQHSVRQTIQIIERERQTDRDRERERKGNRKMFKKQKKQAHIQEEFIFSLISYYFVID